MNFEIDVKPLEAGLYLCATPIGNMGDITMRAVAVLASVSAVYCEDTRNSGLLLERLGIKKPLSSCHEHNENSAAERIIERIRGGEAVAYISDAGMPAISDPGERLVCACIEAGVHFEVIPGASAFVAAAVLSGLSTKELYFVGFLPREGKQRKQALANLRKISATIILYESPYRVAATLEELALLLGGQRRAAVSREITKLFEETARGTLGTLAEKFADSPPKGECVISIEGAADSEGDGSEGLDAMLTRLLNGGMSVKDAAKQASFVLDVPKNTAYARASILKEGGSDNDA